MMLQIKVARGHDEEDNISDIHEKLDCLVGWLVGCVLGG